MRRTRSALPPPLTTEYTLITDADRIAALWIVVPLALPLCWYVLRHDRNG